MPPRSQRRPTPAAAPPHARARLALCALLACGGAAAQDVDRAAGGGLRVTSSLDTTLTYLQNNAGGDRHSDFVSELRPGVQLSSRSGRIRGSLAYALSVVHHTGATDAPVLQNSLNAAFTAEAIEHWAWIDATATVGQGAVSAYGPQYAGGSTDAGRSNNTEIATVSVTPYVRGLLGDFASYDARLNAGATNARHSIAGDSTTSGGALSLSSAHPGALFGWGLQGTRQRSRFRGGNATENDRAILSLSAMPDPELLLTVRGGQESTDVGSLYRRHYGNWGVEARWTPTERTLALLATDRRYFGQSHQLVLEHRMPLSALRFSSVRGASDTADPNGIGQPVTLYQLFYRQFASVQPDPALREQLVLDFLRSLGQNPYATVAGGFVSSGVTLQRRQDLSLSFAGKRLTLSLQAYASETSVLDNPTLLLPDPGPVRQQGYTATLAHRLTPTSTLSLTGSRLLTLSSPTQASNHLESLLLGYTEQLGRRTSATLSARYSVFHSAVDPYTEAAVAASLGLRF